MADPKGPLVVLVAFDPDGNPRACELTADDFLRVYVEGGSVAVVGHNILDGDVHLDSVLQAVTRGSIIVGNATPKHDKLAIGADNAVLASDGTDLAYETLASLIKAALLTSDGDILIRTGGTVQRLAIGSAGEALTVTAGAPAWAGAGGGLYNAYVCVQDEKSDGTHGGTFTQDAWRKRDLNVEKHDAAGIASVASDQITLEAGTFRTLIFCTAKSVGNHQARLQDITNTATLTLGQSQVGSTSSASGSSARVQGRFTLAAQAVLEVQHYCEDTTVTTGFGEAADTGAGEIYTIAEFWRET